MHPKAKAYEKLYPNTGVSESQAIERMERIEQKRAPGVTRSSRLFSVPELPWLKGKT